MIRFPERSHASVTPGAHRIGVEPNYQETERKPAGARADEHRNAGGPQAPRFDFTAINAVLGH